MEAAGREGPLGETGAPVYEEPEPHRLQGALRRILYAWFATRTCRGDGEGAGGGSSVIAPPDGAVALTPLSLTLPRPCGSKPPRAASTWGTHATFGQLPPLPSGLVCLVALGA